MNNAQILFQQASGYLHQALGEDLLPDGVWGGAAQMPRYIDQTYDIGKARLAEGEVLLLTSKEKAPPLPALLKQRTLIQKESGLPVIWVGERLQAYVRKEMVAQRAPFIIPFEQAYLPFLGVHFQERALIKHAETKEALHVATQVFLINAVLGNLPDDLNPKELVKLLGYSLMTMTRIKSELIEHGWLDVATYKNEKIWKLKLQKNELWNAIKPYLQNPVRKRVWIRRASPELMGLPLAGISALANQTLLGEPSNVVRAIGELDWRKFEKQLTATDRLPEAIESAYELEIWRYAPQRIRLSLDGITDPKNDYVDPCSLFLSLEKMDDERVQLALKDLMRGLD